MEIKRVLLFIVFIAFIWSCKKDDGPSIQSIPPRLLSEVVAEDDTEIKEYLQTHFYNYEEFENPEADFDFKIKISALDDDSDKIPLIDQVESMVINVSASDFGLSDGEENIPHTLYYLIAREGMGNSPTVGDSTLLRYEGFTQDGGLFDATPTYTWQYSPFTLRGYSAGISKFKVGDEIIVNDNGTTSIENTGIGLLFIPSGLAYFNGNGPTGTLASYSILIFEIETGLFVDGTDYDNDGIPSIMEDLNGDGNLNNDNTDGDITQFGQLYNHLDPDDDNDGIPTREEIEDSQGNIIFPYPDTDGDGTPDYLDADS